MAEVGDILGHLRIDIAPWQQGLQQAQQQLRQFEQSIARLTGQLNQFSQAFQQAFTQNQQGLTALPQRAEQATRGFQQFNTQLNATRQTFVNITQTVQQFNTSITQTATQVNAAGQAMQQAQRGTSAFANILQIAAGIGLATSIQGMVTAVARFGQEVVQTGARLEQLRTSLTAIAGSTTGGTQQFQFLLTTAQRLGVAFEPLAQGWRRLTAAATAANIPMADQQRLFNAVANEARRVGTTTDELNRLLTGLAQVFAKGKLSAEEWRQQIGEALPTATGALTRGMGRTTEELDKLMTTGSVGVMTFARAFTRGLEDVQQASGKMADGATQAFNRLKTSWQAFQDALANSGVNQYFAQVADNLREAVEWSTRLLRPPGQGPVQGPTPQGPTLMGGTAAQQQEEQRLQSIIERYGKLAEAAVTPAMREHYATMVSRAREQLDQLREAIGLTQTQATEQAKVTAEVNKTTTAQGIQADYVKDLRKALEDLRKAREDYNKEAALAPERMGRPGTAEFLQGLQKATQTQLEAVTTLAARPPVGAVLPPDLRRELAAEDIQFGRREQAIESLRDKEVERRRIEREGAAQAERAVAQEISLTGQLARLKEQMGRVDTSAAAQAASRARQEGAAQLRDVQEALRQFQESPALRQRAPELQKAFEDLKAALPAATEAAALHAFNESIRKDAIEPLERLAEAYGEVKAARDVDTASSLEAAAANTIHAARAKELADRIRDVARVEAQLPDLRRQAEASARAGEEAIKQVQDEAKALEDLEDQLERVRFEREALSLSGGRTREDLRLQQRTREDIRTPAGREQAEAIQRETIRTRLETERLVQVLDIWRDLAQGIGSAWTQALSSIADGTRTVSEAFRAMGQSILQTMADIAAQQAFQALFKLGTGLILGALAGPTVSATQYSSPIGPGLEGMPGGAFVPTMASGAVPALQHGGIVRTPTLAMIAENPATAPEAILNRQQLQSLFGEQRAALRTGETRDLSPLLDELQRLFGRQDSRRGVHADEAREEEGRMPVLLPQLQDLFRGMGTRRSEPPGSLVAAAEAARPVIPFQQGGIVRAPTMAMVGENPSTAPEAILNRQQLQSLFGSGAGAGGPQGQAGISIINVPNRQQAEQTAAQERALGRSAVINYVNENLALGESSSILRSLRTLQR